MADFTLEDLAGIVAARAGCGDTGSYTAQLAGKGVAACARKMGEEAVETVIAAVAEDRTRLASEAADLLYHLLVLLHAAGVPFANVTAELQRRTAQSGLAEKAGRGGAG
jgi:phosphoribosyl-ATP pyrophosphohydrolase